MSLINDMLQDLETRRASASERSAVPRHVRVLPPAREHWARRYAPSGAIMIAAVAATLAYLQQGDPQAKQQSAAIVTQAVAAPRVQGPSTVASAESHAISLQERPPVPVASAAVIATEPAVASAARSKADVLPASSAETSPAPTSMSIKELIARAEQPTANTFKATFSLRMDALPAERVPAPDSGAQLSTGKAQIDRKVRDLSASQLAENEYRAGASLLNQGRIPEAQERFSAALHHAPMHVGARHGLFGLLLQANRTSEAEQVLHAGLRIDAAQPGFAMALARLQVERGDAITAIETLQKSLLFAGSNPDYFAFLAALLQRQGRHSQAAELYQSALALAPRSGIWHMGLGISLQALNRNGDAQDAFRRAKATETLNGELHAFVEQRLKQLQ